MMTQNAPLPDDPFAILELPRTFALTPAQVAAAHLKVAAKLHPDRAKDALQRDHFLRTSAAAGQAKQQLMTDVGRAEALLNFSGAPAAEAKLTPAFLAQALELRERIEEAADDAASLAEIREEVDHMRADCVLELARSLEGGDVPAAREALARLRYVERMSTRLRAQPE
jgi:Fe-S protein assembly co-chaperone HscB